MSWRHVALMVVVSGLCGMSCREPPGASEKPSSTQASSAPTGDLGFVVKTTRGPAPIRRAFGWSTTSSVIYVHLTTDPDADCASLSTGDPKVLSAPKSGHQAFRFRLVPELERNGQTRWRVAPLVGDEGAKERTATEVQSSDVTSEITAKIDVDFESQGVSVTGPLTLTGCGRTDQNSKLARPQRDVALAIAGRSFDVRGAVIRADAADSWSLSLSTAPMGCSITDPVGDVELRLTSTSTLGTIRGAYLFGEILEPEMAAKPSPDQWQVTLGTPGEHLMPIELDGDYMHDGYRVRVEGKLVAQYCEE